MQDALICRCEHVRTADGRQLSECQHGASRVWHNIHLPADLRMSGRCTFSFNEQRDKPFADLLPAAKSLLADCGPQSSFSTASRSREVRTTFSERSRDKASRTERSRKRESEDIVQSMTDHTIFRLKSAQVCWNGFRRRSSVAGRRYLCPSSHSQPLLIARPLPWTMLAGLP